MVGEGFEEGFFEEEYGVYGLELEVLAISADLLEKPRFFRFMYVLYGLGYATAAMLMRTLRYSEGAVRRYARLAVKYGLAKYVRGIDGRKKFLKITSRGKAIVEKASESLLKIVEEKCQVNPRTYYSSLSSRDLDEIAKVLVNPSKILEPYVEPENFLRKNGYVKAKEYLKPITVRKKIADYWVRTGREAEQVIYPWKEEDEWILTWKALEKREAAKHGAMY